MTLVCSLTFAGCSTTVQNTTNTQEPAIAVPTSSPESMMNAPLVTPMVQATPVDISADAQLKSTKPMGTDDDPQSLKSDLTNTTIANETFN